MLVWTVIDLQPKSVLQLMHAHLPSQLRLLMGRVDTEAEALIVARRDHPDFGKPFQEFGGKLRCLM